MWQSNDPLSNQLYTQFNDIRKKSYLLLIFFSNVSMNFLDQIFLFLHFVNGWKSALFILNFESFWFAILSICILILRKGMQR